MATLSAHSERIFQNLSMPFALEDSLLTPPVSSSLYSPPGVGTIVSSLSAVVATTKTTWLTRKSSFRAAAKTIRSVSMTTMAAVSSSQQQKSPSTHHRVSSVKSAKASLMRRPDMPSSSSNPTFEVKPERKKLLGSGSKGDATFDLDYDSPDDADNNEAVAHSFSSTSSTSTPSSSSNFHDDDDDDDDDDVSIEGSKSSKEDSPPFELEDSISIEEAASENWEQEACRIKRERIDSTCTNQVTFLNTLLNKNLTTPVGNAIRRRIADDPSTKISVSLSPTLCRKASSSPSLREEFDQTSPTNDTSGSGPTETLVGKLLQPKIVTKRKYASVKLPSSVDVVASPESDDEEPDPGDKKRPERRFAPVKMHKSSIGVSRSNSEAVRARPLKTQPRVNLLSRSSSDPLSAMQNNLSCRVVKHVVQPPNALIIPKLALNPPSPQPQSIHRSINVEPSKASDSRHASGDSDKEYSPKSKFRLDVTMF